MINIVDLKVNFKLSINIQIFITNQQAVFHQENKDGLCNHKRWRRNFL